MKIVVLAGGLSAERAVSLVTGCGVCRALRERGHRAIFADMFLGLEALPEDPEHPEGDKFYGFVFQDTDFSKWR